MAVVKPSYSTSASTVSVTLASLANSTTLSSGYRQSASVDNSTNLFLDAIITGKFTTAAGTVATGYVAIYVYGYDGSEFSNNASGSDAAYTSDATGNLLPVATVVANVASSSFYLPPTYVAGASGLPFLPQKWGLIVQNVSGGTLSSVSASHLLEYQGINVTVA